MLNRLIQSSYYITVQLIGGGSDNEGNVLLLHRGERGLICDDSWDSNDATVICRMLGYRYCVDIFTKTFEISFCLTRGTGHLIANFCYFNCSCLTRQRYSLLVAGASCTQSFSVTISVPHKVVLSQHWMSFPSTLISFYYMNSL